MKKLLLIILLIPVAVWSQAPGGVTSNIKLWLKANLGISTSGGNVIGWIDQTSTNTFTVTGTPVLSSYQNYNITVAFNGSSRLTGNTSIATATHAFVVGKIANPSGVTASGALIGSTSVTGFQYFFHTEGGKLYCGGNTNSIYTGYTSPNSIPYSLLSEDLGKTPAASDMIRLNGENKTNSANNDPAPYSGIPAIGSRGTENILAGSEIAEAILYNTSLSAVNVNKIESYLAVKYGLTLSNAGGGTNGDYTSSTGAIIWDADNGSGYHNNVIGIGRDDNSALIQRQSQQSDDSTRIYLAELGWYNGDNDGVFAANNQFIMMGSNAASLSNTGSVEFPAGISGRIDREWKITNTGFSTGTFSIDIKMPAGCLPGNLGDLRLLVDADGNFSSGAAISTTGLSYSYSDDVLTISGIGTSQIPSNSTRYITLAAATLTGGTVSSSQNIHVGNMPAAISVSGNSGSVIKWQYSADNFVSDIHDIPASASAVLTSGQMGVLMANRYYRVVIQNAFCINAFSSIIAIMVTQPGGIPANLSLWLKADAGVTATGANVSQWTNQSFTAMTTEAGKTASANVTLNTNAFNYNPAIVFDGTSGQRLAGQYASASTAANNPALFFAVVKKNGSSASCCTNPFALGPAASMGIGYHDGTSNVYGADGNGAVCSATQTGVDVPAIIRVDYNSVSTTTGAVAAFNGLASTACGNVGVAGADGTFEVGGRTGGGLSGRIYKGSIAEMIHYNSNSITATEVKKVESYLAIKYGLLLSNNGGGTSGDYLSSPGTTVWDADNGSSYHNSVIGIGRDDNSALLQKQSHQWDDSTRIYLATLQSSNTANTGSFSSDAAFVIMGHNNQPLKHTYGSANEYPPGLGIYSRIDREWKITNTNFTGSFSIDIKLNTSLITASDIRILIDDDGDFSNAILYNPAIGYSGGVVTISGITNSMISASSTKYLTVVSLNSSTPLPVRLVNFNAVSYENKYVTLNWQTASENNNLFFGIERSVNGIQWQEIARMNGAGNSNQLLSYSYIDSNPITGASYYRLKQIDADERYSWSAVRLVHMNPPANSKLAIYPNPATDYVAVEGMQGIIPGIIVYDAMGRNMSQYIKITVIDNIRLVVEVSILPQGIYIIKTKVGSAKFYKQRK